MKKYKYFTVYLLPLLALMSFYLEGYKTFITLFVFLGIIPFVELFTKPVNSNLKKEIALREKKVKLYDWILYLVVPIQYSVLIIFLFNIKETPFLSLSYFGKITSMGLCCGILGINVGHELGHRNHRFYQLLGEILLLSSLNTHFLPYHNAGHHYLVATKKDPATARKNESIYAFWIRSHFSSYFLAWTLENKRMKRIKRNRFGTGNRMIFYGISNLVLVGIIFVIFGTTALLAFLAAALMGILLLESINYIEHYGLLRKKNGDRHERVQPKHSWNSNHPIGRYALFNLSRHSDHHKNGSKKYQLLNSYPESPQLPTGYPGMVLLALIPPLWKWYMNKKIEEFENN